MINEELPEIEVLQSEKPRYARQMQGGEITVYRLRLMTREQIKAHGLQKYTPEEGEGNAE